MAWTTICNGSRRRWGGRADRAGRRLRRVRASPLAHPARASSRSATRSSVSSIPDRDPDQTLGDALGPHAARGELPRASCWQDAKRVSRPRPGFRPARTIGRGSGNCVHSRSIPTRPRSSRRSRAFVVWPTHAEGARTSPDTRPSAPGGVLKGSARSRGRSHCVPPSRTGSVLIPRSTSQESKGERMAPAAFWINCRRSASPFRARTTIPPTLSL